MTVDGACGARRFFPAVRGGEDWPDFPSERSGSRRPAVLHGTRKMRSRIVDACVHGMLRAKSGVLRRIPAQDGHGLGTVAGRWYIEGVPPPCGALNSAVECHLHTVEVAG